MEKPKSVAGYLKSLPPDRRAAVQRLPETIAAAAPEADEASRAREKAVRTRLAEADAKRVTRKT